MNKTVRNLLIIALAMILAGAVFVATGHAFGARLGWQWIFSGFSPGVNVGGLSGYRNWNNAFNEDGNYYIDAQGLDSLELDWIAGNVIILIYDGSEVKLCERSAAPVSEGAALRYGMENGTLYVQYCAPEVSGNLPEKELTVSIPKSLADNMDTFSYDASSASLLVSNITAKRFLFDSSSGDLDATGMKADKVTLDASSGKVSFSGAYDTLEADTSSGAVTIESLGGASSTSIDTSSGDVSVSGDCGALSIGTTSGVAGSFGALSAESLSVDTSSGRVNLAGSFGRTRVGTTSGDVTLALDACPDKLSISTSSGDVTLSLPAQSGFTLRYDTSSGEMSCDFAAVKDGNQFAVGDGAADFSVDTSSGSLRVKAK
ncbi:MAG TPA: DUF4097 family beta strand repeat-containing protein [Clostridia bacterium]|nr:DUF4097 family beta strand repeat-containing protein [Clostridia bacterium]